MLGKEKVVKKRFLENVVSDLRDSVKRNGKKLVTIVTASSLMFFSGYAYRDCGQKVYPPLSKYETIVFSKLKDNPFAVQQWINYNEFYMFDFVQFQGNLCDKYFCDIWMPATYTYRTRRGDCDDILMFSHYFLRSGVGLTLGDYEGHGHAVYLYKENGKYGVISINILEQTGPEFNSIEDAADIFSSYYSFYRVVDLPDDDNDLLYNFRGRDLSRFGKLVYFNRGKEK